MFRKRSSRREIACRALATGLASAILVTGSGCATAPESSIGGTQRSSAEALYNEAPWVDAQPTNIRGMANIAVAATQGLADVSATYSEQLRHNQAAQLQYLSNPSATAQRSNDWQSCLGVGGGTQGGMKCESIGYAAYKQEYIDAKPQLSELQNENAWPPKNEGWMQIHRPLFTEMEAIELGQAMYGGGQGYGSFSRASGRAARAYYSR